MKNSKFITKFIATILMVILTMSLCSTAIAAEGMKAGRYIVTADKLILRDAQKNGEEICQIPRGEEVHVVRDCTSHEFMVPITWGDAYGYVSRDYLSEIVVETTEVIQQPQKSQEEKKKASPIIGNEMAQLIGYAVRETPILNSDDKVIGKIAEGEMVYVVTLRRDLYTIVYQGNKLALVPGKDIQVTDINIPGEGKILKVKSDVDFALIRMEPDSGTPGALVESGQYLRQVEVGDGWIRVAYTPSGDTGYISTQYVVEITPENSTVFRAKE